MGGMRFNVRLFADDNTVVEQEMGWWYWSPTLPVLRPNSTTENGRPVPVRYDFLDGKAILFAADPWQPGGPEGRQCDECLAYSSGTTSGYISLAEASLANVSLASAEGCLEGAKDPSPVEINGIAAVALDGTGTEACHLFSHWYGSGSPVRFYLIELPSSSTQTLPVAVIAKEGTLGGFMAAAEPIIESIEFDE
jgi:hypothetical protein